MAKDYSDEAHLLEQLKKHNVKAYEFLYVNSRKYLYVLAFSILNNEEQAKDLLQEFYSDFWEFKLYERINKSLNAYLYFAVRNRAFDFKRNERSYFRLMEQFASAAEVETPRYFENEELKVQIESAINKLPPMASKAFKMHYLESYSHNQIAEALGISKRTVANHIHRALAFLRSELKNKL